LISRGIGDFSIYPARACFAKRFNQPDFFYPERLILSIFGSTSGLSGTLDFINLRVNLGRTRGNRNGWAQKKRKLGEFCFRGILQPTTVIFFQ